jgi:hypothetical protein
MQSEAVQMHRNVILDLANSVHLKKTILTKTLAKNAQMHVHFGKKSVDKNRSY